MKECYFYYDNLLDVLCYDDACQLKHYAQNPVRKDASDITTKMATILWTWCVIAFTLPTIQINGVRKHAIRTEGSNIKDVNTEVCEQLFSWLSRFSYITKHMNRWRLLFLMLYLIDNHNEDVANTL